MEAATAVAMAAVITAVAIMVAVVIVAVVMAIISAAGIMAAAISTAERRISVLSPATALSLPTVHSPHIA